MKKKMGILFLAMLVLSAGTVSLFAAGEEEAAVSTEIDLTTPVTITIMPQNDNVVDPDSAFGIWQENYISKKLGFKVDFEFMYFERAKERELLALSLIDGVIPDVFQGYPDAQFRDFVDQGVVREIDLELMKEIAPTYFATLDKYGGGESFWNFGKGPDGKQYGVPGISYNGQFHYTPVIRDDWLKAVGIDKKPETLDELEAALYAFRNDDPNGSGEKDTYGISNTGLPAIFGAYGGIPPHKDGQTIKWTLDDAGKINSHITTDNTRDALVRLAQWYADGVIDPEWVTGENKGGYWARSVAFNNGLVGYSMPAMFYHVEQPIWTGNPDSGWCTYKPFVAANGEEATYDWAHLPIGPDGKAGAPQWGVVEGWYAVYGLNVTDEQLVKWWMIAELLCTDSILQTSQLFGIPEVQWEYVDGVATKIEGAPNAEEGDFYNGAPIAGAPLSTGGIDRISSIAWDSEVISERYATQQYDFAKISGGSGQGLPNLVFGDFPSKSIFSADVETLTVEAFTEFINGSRDINDDAVWAAFKATVTKAGLPRLTSDAQAWYDMFY